MKLKLLPDYLIEQYVKNNKSTITIAKEANYSAESIRKALKKFNIERRCHSDAQTNYLKTSTKHPTKGKIRSEETCERIKEGLKKYWANKTGKGTPPEDTGGN